MKATDSFLECQTCGKMIRKLSPTEAQLVAQEPYNYIIDCRPCAKYLEGLPG